MMPQQPQPFQGRTVATLDQDPFWGDSYASQKHRADVGSTDATARALAGLHSAAGMKREIGNEDAANDASQLQQFGIDRAGVGENIGDFVGERAAGRQLMPQASKVYQRGREAATTDAVNRYVTPAMINSQGDVDAASIAGESRIEAARQSRAPVDNSGDIAMKGLTEAILAQMARHGGKGEIDSKQLNTMAAYLQGLR